MRKLIVLIYKSIRKLFNVIVNPFDYFCTYILFISNGVFFKSFEVKGIPFVSVTYGSRFSIGESFKMNNSTRSNPIGRVGKCTFFVAKNASLIIGSNVGMSSTSIFCRESIVIGDNVKFGGNVVIYDTDFHSLDPVQRKDPFLDSKFAKNRAVRIGNDVFIGAHTTILKGVEIGDNVIVGACSVVTKPIPDNQIWGGNPAKFLRHL